MPVFLKITLSKQGMNSCVLFLKQDFKLSVVFLEQDFKLSVVFGAGFQKVLFSGVLYQIKDCEVGLRVSYTFSTRFMLYLMYLSVQLKPCINSQI